MDWLTRLPLVGPWMARLMRTHAWRAYETLERVRWARLAAAITFISFLALFPLVTVAAAIGAAVLSDARMRELEKNLAEQVPGISGQLDLSALTENAGTIGVVAGAVLLFTGIGWVGSLRECLRAVWELEEDPGNPVMLKLKDTVVLFGLGGVALGSVGVSAFAATAVDWAAGRLGLAPDGIGGWLLTVAAFAAAVAADVLLLGYVLTLLPHVQPPRRAVIVAALIGAVGFELLKLLLSGYMKGVAAKSMYGAFGVPVALLLWINFTAKLMLFCAAWTATEPGIDSEEADMEAAEDEDEGEDTEAAKEAVKEADAGEETAKGGGGDPPTPPPPPPPPPTPPAERVSRANAEASGGSHRTPRPPAPPANRP